MLSRRIQLIGIIILFIEISYTALGRKSVVGFFYRLFVIHACIPPVKELYAVIVRKYECFYTGKAVQTALIL